MKNLINQLWASQASGAKSFETREGTNFGWPVIEAMWLREKDKRAHHLIRMVPRLIHSFIKRDPWTKLNVAPAKIMQVSLHAHVISQNNFYLSILVIHHDNLTAIGYLYSERLELSYALFNNVIIFSAGTSAQ